MGNAQRLREALEELIDAVNDLPPGDRTGGMDKAASTGMELINDLYPPNDQTD